MAKRNESKRQQKILEVGSHKSKSDVVVQPSPHSNLRRVHISNYSPDANAAQSEVSKLRKCHVKLLRIKEDKSATVTDPDRGTSVHCPERVGECGSKIMETRQKKVAKRLGTQKSAKLTSKRPITKKLAERTKRISKRGSLSVFEFPSQTQTSDTDAYNDKDPAADIVQRMIDKGNVKVVTRRNGRGITKRKKQVASCLKKKRIPEPTSNDELQQHKENLQIMDNEPFQYECILPALVAPISSYRPSVDVRKQNECPNKATFSHLARSVLIQQAEKLDFQHNNVTKQRRLLAAAEKFVSTPVNRKVPVPPHTSNLSPIASSDLAGNVSPWRVNDHEHYPSAFNFGTNSSFLPTFSSDNIPASPPKSSQGQNSRLNLPTSPTEMTISRNLNASSARFLSPISSNDSNAENVPPPGMTSTASDPCTSSINLRKLPNSRQAIASCRTPLKTINILEVVKLPSWRKNSAKTNHNSGAADVDARHIELEKSHDDNMFGFEEFLPDESDQMLNKSTLQQPNHEILREKLHELRKWRPEDNELLNGPDQLILNENNCDGRCGAMKQPSIKEMLCSTMIQPNLQTDVRRLSNDYSNLFKDPDPDCTFDETQSRRTYLRPVQRKRKIRHNFVMFPDSEDSSDSEEITHDKHERKKCNRDKPNVELNSFVSEFNDMCKEVEQYQLIVE